nr:uncharacterized protein LOC109153434 [Ipomoea batatas]
MKSLDKFGVDLEAGECGDGGLRNSTAVSGVRRPCSSEAMEVGNTEVSGVPPEKMIYSMSECSVEFSPFTPATSFSFVLNPVLAGSYMKPLALKAR